MDEQATAAQPRLSEICWPVFDVLIGFDRQVRSGEAPDAEQVRYELVHALGDAEDLARRDPTADRLWERRVKQMLVYLIDYKLLNSEWPGREYWWNHLFQTDPEILGEIEALGGEKFFQECDEVQKDYDLASSRHRADAAELGDLLALYYICLRLGFKGRYHDQPQELAEYTRRLFTRLPAYARTRETRIFGDQYNPVIRPRPVPPGMAVTMLLLIAVVVVVAIGTSFRLAWKSATKEIQDARERLVEQVAAGPAESAERK